MPSLDYIRDPQEIYRQSFKTIRSEMDLTRFAGDEAAIAVRIAHACGMTDITNDLVIGGTPAHATREAMAAGRPAFCDTEMVRAALITRFLPTSHDVRCELNNAHTPDLARSENTTRSAAAVTLWQQDLEGAVAIIGNAPTALFALLETIDATGRKPAAVFAFPVGFVGAVESKNELIANPRGLNFAALRGRRGGSAIAGAAFNAVFAGAQDR